GVALQRRFGHRRELDFAVDDFRTPEYRFPLAEFDDRAHAPALQGTARSGGHDGLELGHPPAPEARQADPACGVARVTAQVARTVFHSHCSFVISLRWLDWPHPPRPVAYVRLPATPAPSAAAAGPDSAASPPRARRRRRRARSLRRAPSRHSPARRRRREAAPATAARPRAPPPSVRDRYRRWRRSLPAAPSARCATRTAD